jgi:hypothetical protein
MAKKTFKIGEYCVGGIIVAEATKTNIKITVLHWVSKKVYDTFERKITTENFYRDDDRQRALNEADNYLNEITSNYYSDKVLDFIKKNCPPF